MEASNNSPQLPILFVDDEPQILRIASLTLRSAGIRQVLLLNDSREVLSLLNEQQVSIVVLDLTMPYLSGEQLLEQINEQHPDIPVIIMTATNDLETAVKCMRIGAFDYLVKPVEKNRLVSAVHRALEIRALREEVLSLKSRLLTDQVQHPEAFAAIVTRNRAMSAIFQYIEAVAPSPQPVLIAGETGTGKELVAQAVHVLSGHQGKFVTVNVAGLDDNVFSDTLFGHKKGAFTGAERQREGLIAEASGGTLFLDEIGDLAESSQVKLLRLLQDRRYYPLGSDQQRESTARVVVATNRDLVQMVKEGTFRKDLYYRLRGHHIVIPPLRERKDDLPLLVNHFIRKAACSIGRNPPNAPPQLLSLLHNYHFPGNVREMEAMIFDAVARQQGRVLSLRSFREMIDQEQLLEDEEQRAESVASLADLFPDRLPTLKEAEQLLVEEALKRADGNQGIAASMLGLTRQALNKRLNRERNR